MEINGSISHRNDVAKNWVKAINFTPNKGELIIYNPDAAGESYTKEVTIAGKTYTVESSSSVRFKIGNGVSNVNALPFVATGGSGSSVDLTGYATEVFVKDEIDKLNIDDLEKEIYGDEEIAGIKTTLAGYGGQIESLWTHLIDNDNPNSVDNQLDRKADKNDIYTQSYLDGEFDKKVDKSKYDTEMSSINEDLPEIKSTLQEHTGSIEALNNAVGDDGGIFDRLRALDDGEQSDTSIADIIQTLADQATGIAAANDAINEDGGILDRLDAIDGEDGAIERLESKIDSIPDDIVVSDTEPSITELKDKMIWLQPYVSDTGAVDYIIEQGIEKDSYNKLYYEKWNNGVIKYYFSALFDTSKDIIYDKIISSSINLYSKLYDEKSVICHNMTLHNNSSENIGIKVIGRGITLSSNTNNINIAYDIIFDNNPSDAITFIVYHEIIGFWK